MLSLLKTVGYGVLLIVLSPLIAIGLILLIIYSVFNYLVFDIANFFLFFRGKSFKNDDKETLLLRQLMQQEESIHNMQVQQAAAFAANYPSGTIPGTPPYPNQSQGQQSTHVENQEVTPPNSEGIESKQKQGGNENDSD